MEIIRNKEDIDGALFNVINNYESLRSKLGLSQEEAREKTLKQFDTFLEWLTSDKKQIMGGKKMMWEGFKSLYGHWLKYLPEEEYEFFLEQSPHVQGLIDRTVKNCIERIDPEQFIENQKNGEK